MELEWQQGKGNDSACRGGAEQGKGSGGSKERSMAVLLGVGVAQSGGSSGAWKTRRRQHSWWPGRREVGEQGRRRGRGMEGERENTRRGGETDQRGEGEEQSGARRRRRELSSVTLAPTEWN
jgi:hypothetical protein